MFEHLEASDTSVLELNNLDGSPMVYVDKDGKEHRATMNIRSRTCDAIRTLNNTIQRRRLEQSKKKGSKPDAYDPDQAHKDGVDRLKAIIAGWDNLPDGKGGVIKFSQEALQALVEHPKLDYIHSQVFRHHAADENFMKA